MRPTVQIINNSTVISNAALQPIVDAVQIQVSRDFSPVWNMNANLSLLPEGQNPDPKAWWLLIADDSDQAKALGYHDFTNGGLPLGKVFAKTDIMSGSSVSVTISHETLEVLGDPFLSNCIIQADGARFWAAEVCDAVESDQFGYEITLPSGATVLVSDFQTRAWFGSCPATSNGVTIYDFARHCTMPFEILQSGYQSFFDTRSAQWLEATTDQRSVAARKQYGSRYEIRRRFRDNQCGKPSEVAL